jgi:hypothetical protein
MFRILKVTLGLWAMFAVSYLLFLSWIAIIWPGNNESSSMALPGVWLLSMLLMGSTLWQYPRWFLSIYCTLSLVGIVSAWQQGFKLPGLFIAVIISISTAVLFELVVRRVTKDDKYILEGP